MRTLLASSTWAYPIIGGLHVLGVVWFGGAVLLSALNGRPRAALLWTGAVFMLVTGALLVAIEPQRCAASVSFWAKMLLLVALAVARGARSAALKLALWAAVILASRGIAFF